jgi:carbamoyl-phosphate synthase/aspartate carbamoyltransferase/dihydroorotase
MSAETLALPGLVDMHVHLREPGAEEKEDLATGSRAAIAGGVVAVMDMPNNPYHATNTAFRLREKHDLAKGRMYCDVGFYYGSQPADNNIGTFDYAVRRAVGLKSYLEVTTGNTSGKEPKDFKRIWENWHKLAAPTQPIVLHSEERTIQEALSLVAGQIGHPTHVAHISNKAELDAVIAAREKGWPVTCGVTPHHLFLNSDDVTSWYRRMKPPLGPLSDQEYLWKHLDDIDVVETDHAPHSIDEKEEANRLNPDGLETGVTSYGVPGLEMMLPLLLHAMEKNKLTYERIVQMTSVRPREILGLPRSRGNTVRVLMMNYEVAPHHIWSKCGWSPYLGRMVTGRVVEVSMRGLPVFNDSGFGGREALGRVISPIERAA